MNPRYTFPRGNPGERIRCTRFVIEQMGRLPLDQDWEVEIRRKSKDRTSPQNRYLHAMFGEIAKASGHTPDEVKEALVRKFLGSEQGEFGGVQFERRRSTTKLTTAECAALCDQVHAWAAEQGLLLPLPEEFYR